MRALKFSNLVYQNTLMTLNLIEEIARKFIDFDENWIFSLRRATRRDKVRGTFERETHHKQLLA